MDKPPGKPPLEITVYRYTGTLGINFKVGANIGLFP